MQIGKILFANPTTYISSKKEKCSLKKRQTAFQMLLQMSSILKESKTSTELSIQLLIIFEGMKTSMTLLKILHIMSLLKMAKTLIEHQNF